MHSEVSQLLTVKTNCLMTSAQFNMGSSTHPFARGFQTFQIKIAYQKTQMVINTRRSSIETSYYRSMYPMYSWAIPTLQSLLQLENLDHWDVIAPHLAETGQSICVTWGLFETLIWWLRIITKNNEQNQI